MVIEQHAVMSWELAGAVSQARPLAQNADRECGHVISWLSMAPVWGRQLQSYNRKWCPAGP
jgi:hypothetical protein